jgi:ankyrin repeat protein
MPIYKCEICGCRIEKIEDKMGNRVGGIFLTSKEKIEGIGVAEQCQECGRFYCSACYPSRPKNSCVCGKGRDRIMEVNGVVYRGSIRLVKVRYPAWSEDDTSIIHTEVAKGNIKKLKHLLESGANANAKETMEGQTPLHITLRRPRGSEKDVASICNLLIQFGADVNAKDNDGITPLHWAVGRMLPKVVRLIIDAGCSVNITDNNGYTPLHQAADVRITNEDQLRPVLDIINILLKAGSGVNALSNRGETPLQIAESHSTITSKGRDLVEPIRDILRKNGGTR